jgi:osmotically-inducible protein OsmY
MVAEHRQTDGGVASASGLRAVLVLLVLFLVPVLLHAQSPDISARHNPHDIRITLKALQALAQDSELARYPIFVTVRQGNMTVWGQVPNEGLSRRALKLAGSVQGVFQAHSELVIGPVEPIRDETPRLPGPIRLPYSGETPVRRDPRPRGVPTGNPRSPPSYNNGAEFGRPTPLGASSADTPKSAVLLPPGALEKKESLQSMIERTIGSDVRFAGIRFDERAGTVTLSGNAARMEHVLDLSRLVARLPGIKEVIVENVRITTR